MPEPRLTSPREWKILMLLARGYTFRGIADRLYIATGTVETHLQHIMQRPHLRQQSELPRLSDPKAGRAFLIWLPNEVGTAAAEELAQAVAAWVREHLRRLPPRGTVRVIYRPDDKLLAEVRIFENGRDE